MLYLIMSADGKITVPPALWEIMKAYAGIYHITCDWKIARTLPTCNLLKLSESMSIKCPARDAVFRAAAVSLSAKEEKKMLLRSLANHNMNETQWLQIHAEIKEKQARANERIWDSKFSVGDEVFITRQGGKSCGDLIFGAKYVVGSEVSPGLGKTIVHINNLGSGWLLEDNKFKSQLGVVDKINKKSIVVKPYKFAATAVANTSDKSLNCFDDKHNYILKLFYDRTQFEKKRTVWGSELRKNDGLPATWLETRLDIEQEEIQLYHRDYEIVKTVIPDYIRIKGRDNEKETRLQYKREQVRQTRNEIKQFYVNVKNRTLNLREQNATELRELRKKLSEAEEAVAPPPPPPPPPPQPPLN